MTSSISRAPNACSDVCMRFELPDGTKIDQRGRTMDFVCPMGSHFVKINTGVSYSSYAPGEDLGGYYKDGEKGFCWDSTIGAIGVTALGSQNFVDGLNTAGFTAGVLTLNATEYQTVEDHETPMAMRSRDVTKYLLSTCKTVADAKAALRKIKAWRCTIDDHIPFPMPLLHMSLHDAQGNHGVVEYVKGKLKFYDTIALGILTNDPVYPSQYDGLQNYTTFSPVYDLKPVVFNGKMYPSEKDVGNRSVGLPGSTSPIDRFVRMAIITSQMKPPVDRWEARQRIWQVIGNVWAIPGCEVVPVGKYNLEGYTRWALNMNLQAGSISWKTNRNDTPQTILLSDYKFYPQTGDFSLPLSDDGELGQWRNEMNDYLNSRLEIHTESGAAASSSST